MSSFQSGQTIGRYQVVRLLGEGAMGEVYLAEDPRIERKVALKTVRLAGADREVEDRRIRLMREGKAAGRLIHPHIVTLFDVGEEGDLLYLAMEYVEGQDLGSRLEKGPPPTLGDALTTVRQTALGLDHAHRQGVVHRDVKPGNILLDRRGRVKVADFGIAKLAGQATELTQTGSVMGSPFYLSPEQVRGEELDGRSDVFALGAVLYELAAAQRLFAGETITTLVYQILHEEMPPLAALPLGAREVVDDLIRRMVAKDRDQRPESAAAVADELQRLGRELGPALLAAPCGVDDEPTLILEDRSGATASSSVADESAATALSVPPVPVPPVPAPAAPAAPIPSAPAPVSATAREEPSAPASPSSPSKQRAPRGLVIGALVVAALGAVAMAGLFVFGWLAQAKKAESPPTDAGAPAFESSDELADAGATPAEAAPEGEGDEPAEPRDEEVDSIAQLPDEPAATEVTTTVPDTPRPEQTPREESPVAQTAPSREPPGASSSGATAEPPTSATSPATTPTRSPPTPAPSEPRVTESAPAPSRLRGRVDRTVDSSMAVTFRVDPGDAFVLVDGTVIGRAREFADSAYELPGPGEHLVVVRREGRLERRLLVRADPSRSGTTAISVRLGRAAAKDLEIGDLQRFRVREGIVLRIDPRDAQVRVNGTLRGKASRFAGRGRGFLELERGIHRVTLTAPGYERVDIAVEVSSSGIEDRTVVRLTLPRGGS